MIPLIAASWLSIFRADRLRAGPVAAFVFSAAILTGTHTLTLLWGSTFLLGAVAIAALSWREVVRARARRLLRLAGLVTAWDRDEPLVPHPAGRLFARDT